jgi:hypothetical protein
MQHYMIQIPAKGFLAKLDVEQLQTFKQALASNEKVHAFSKVGGGMVIFTQMEDNQHLTVELRKHQIMDAEVTPLVPMVDVLDAYVENKQTGKFGAALL